MTFTQGHALVIGVGSHEYVPEADVPISVDDARAVAQVLQDPRACGYPESQIQILHDEGATKAGILAALDELAQHTKPEDTVFLFYCGHGALGTDGNYYLVSNDAQREKSAVVAGTGLSEGELLDKLKAIQAQRMLLVFNACYSGNISPTLAMEEETLSPSSLPEETSSALLATGSGRIIITACREGQKSYIGSGSLSIFTQAVVDSLRGKGVKNSGGFISAYSLYESIFEVVSEATGEKFHVQQEPELTVLKGVGPFAVALYRGASSLSAFDAEQPAPELPAVNQVKPEKAQRLYQQRIVQTGGVNFGQGNQVQVGDDVVGRDQYTGSVTQVNIQMMSQEGLEAVINTLADRLGLDKRSLQNPAHSAPTTDEHRKIQEVQAVERQAAAQGVSLTPQAAHRMGTIAYYQRDFKTALDYFRQAAQSDPSYSDAFEAIVRLQQNLAYQDFHRKDYPAALEKLAEARPAAEKMDMKDKDALALRGYLEKLLAQIAEAQGNRPERAQYLQTAESYFRKALQIAPKYANALKGLGNVQSMLGNLDAAIELFEKAISIQPAMVMAHHDLAYAYEAKMRNDIRHAVSWCHKALAEWSQVYKMAPKDPSFSPDYIVWIGQHVTWLENQCG